MRDILTTCRNAAKVAMSHVAMPLLEPHAAAEIGSLELQPLPQGRGYLKSFNTEELICIFKVLRVV